MGMTLTLAQVENRSTSDLLRQAARAAEPLTIIVEEGIAVTLKAERSVAPPEEAMELKPLPQFSVAIPEGWKDAIYDYA